jgi:hypothetical protein
MVEYTPACRSVLREVAPASPYGPLSLSACPKHTNCRLLQVVKEVVRHHGEVQHAERVHREEAGLIIGRDDVVSQQASCQCSRGAEAVGGGVHAACDRKWVREHARDDQGGSGAWRRCSAGKRSTASLAPSSMRGSSSGTSAPTSSSPRVPIRMKKRMA